MGSAHDGLLPPGGAVRASVPGRPVSRIVLRGRPKLTAISVQCPTDVVVTCLTEREGALQIVEAVRRAGKESIWLAFTCNSVTEPDLPWLALGAADIAGRLRAGSTVTVHCSAGLHRTGVIAYAALRRAGLSETDTWSTIAVAREQTAQELGRYLELARTVAGWPLAERPPRHLGSGRLGPLRVAQERAL